MAKTRRDTARGRSSPVTPRGRGRGAQSSSTGGGRGRGQPSSATSSGGTPVVGIPMDQLLAVIRAEIRQITPTPPTISQPTNPGQVISLSARACTHTQFMR